jgi:hypothetical protein
MQSIYLGLFLVAVVLLLVWSMKNDRVSKISEQKGWFSMRPPESEEQETVKRTPRAYFEEDVPPDPGEDEARGGADGGQARL